MEINSAYVLRLYSIGSVLEPTQISPFEYLCFEDYFKFPSKAVPILYKLQRAATRTHSSLEYPGTAGITLI